MDNKLHSSGPESPAAAAPEYMQNNLLMAPPILLNICLSGCPQGAVTGPSEQPPGLRNSFSPEASEPATSAPSLPVPHVLWLWVMMVEKAGFYFLFLLDDSGRAVMKTSDHHLAMLLGSWRTSHLN